MDTYTRYSRENESVVSCLSFWRPFLAFLFLIFPLLSFPFQACHRTLYSIVVLLSLKQEMNENGIIIGFNGLTFKVQSSDICRASCLIPLEWKAICSIEWAHTYTQSGSRASKQATIHACVCCLENVSRAFLSLPENRK